MKSIAVVFAFFCAFLILPQLSKAQHALSFDIAAVSNLHDKTNGLNLSAFYHFNEHWEAGTELNRFFPITKTIDGDEVQQSAWDFDYNIHYLIPVGRKWELYPLTGFSHTSEQEYKAKLNETSTENFWSFNTGAGIIYKLGKWSPHIEYSCTWGEVNKQFLIAGFSYELELSKHKKE